MFRPDITVMVGWALTINYLCIYPFSSSFIHFITGLIIEVLDVINFIRAIQCVLADRLFPFCLMIVLIQLLDYEDFRCETLAIKSLFVHFIANFLCQIVNLDH